MTAHAWLESMPTRTSHVQKWRKISTPGRFSYKEGKVRLVQEEVSKRVLQATPASLKWLELDQPPDPAKRPGLIPETNKQLWQLSMSGWQKHGRKFKSQAFC